MVESGNRLRPGAAPGMPGAGFLLPPPIGGGSRNFGGRPPPEFRGLIPGAGIGGGNRGRESEFEVYFHVEMHVKALRPILPQAINKKVKPSKFCVFSIVNNFILFWVSLCICTLTFYMHRAVNRRE